jgi:hypothetical protein
MPIALMLALVAVLVAVPSAAVAKEQPRIGCGAHIEGDGPPPAPDRARDVTRGALTLMGARRLQRHRVPLMRSRAARLGIMLAAGHEATITVAPESRDFVTLDYRREQWRRLSEWQMEFRACRSDAPRFSGEGAVGPRTIWAGGIRIRRPGCVVLNVWDDRGPRDDVRLPLGRPCRPPAATRAVGCAERSQASFPNAWSDPGNLSVGLLTLVGGAQARLASAARSMRERGGWMMPLLLREGSAATLSVAWEARRRARLDYGGEPVRAVRFTACRHGEASGSDVNTWPVTFWSGGVRLTRVPACVPVDLWVEQALARRLRIPFGDPDACSPLRRPGRGGTRS